MVLYSKGLTQEEIAKELGIGQPTVCRDLGEMRKQSRKIVAKQVTEEALFEFSRWMAGLTRLPGWLGKWRRMRKLLRYQS